MLKKTLYSTHRILGTILSILFVVWFLSGFVMIYHTFPRVSNIDRYAHMDILPPNILFPDSAVKCLPEGSIFFKLSLRSYAGKPFFETMSKEGTTQISADSGAVSNKIEITPSFPQIEKYAKKWCNADIVKVDTLRELEQWIPFSYLKKDFPIYKFYFGDQDKHQLYITSQTGDALQFTNKDNRFWSWLGAIPHWVYFTSLRQNTKLWTNVITCLSGIGCIICIAGIIIGIRAYIIQYRKKKEWGSPYRKFAYKWHHVMGFVFGIFVFTFTFSGMMSLNDVPDWIAKVHNPSIEESMLLPYPVILQDYKLNVQKVVEAYSGEIKSIEWAYFGQKPLYKAIVGKKLLTIDASEDSLKLLNLKEPDIKTNLTQVHSEPMKISLMNEYDNYYVGLTDHLPLPVYKVEVADADNSTYYINPKNGNVRYFNTNSKVHKWTYQAFHSYKTGFFAKHPILWNIAMWITLIGGTFVSITGVWLGIKFIIRKVRKFKKSLCLKRKDDKSF